MAQRLTSAITWFASRPGCCCKNSQSQMFNSNSRTYFQIVLSKPQSITQKYQNITKCANQLNISSFFRKPRNANLNSLHKNNRFLESKPVYKQHKCSFHTSSRRPIPPIILALMKPITKVTAAVAGR